MSNSATTKNASSDFGQLKSGPWNMTASGLNIEVFDIEVGPDGSFTGSITMGGTSITFNNGQISNERTVSFTAGAYSFNQGKLNTAGDQISDGQYSGPPVDSGTWSAQAQSGAPTPRPSR